MKTSFNKLWKLLIDRGMNKTDLRNITGLSQATIAKLSKGENVNIEVVLRICQALNCKIEDILEFKEESKDEA